jgi:hypothetical protein
MRAFSQSIVSDRAARQAHVLAWVIVAVTALPYGVVGQSTPLTCDTAVTASIERLRWTITFTPVARGHRHQRRQSGRRVPSTGVAVLGNSELRR